MRWCVGGETQATEKKASRYRILSRVDEWQAHGESKPHRRMSGKDNEFLLTQPLAIVLYTAGRPPMMH